MHCIDDRLTRGMVVMMMRLPTLYLYYVASLIEFQAVTSISHLRILKGHLRECTVYRL